MTQTAGHQRYKYDTLHLVSHLLQHWLQLRLGRVKEPVGLHVGSTECQDVDGSQPRLFARRHKHNHRPLDSMLQNGMVRRLCHCYDTRRIVSYVQALYHQHYIHTQNI